MKIVCVDNRNHRLSLTVGKSYFVLSRSFETDLNSWRYEIINDLGNISWYIDVTYRRLFKPIEEVRQEKLQQLGI